jgi:hypothetical protein
LRWEWLPAQTVPAPAGPGSPAGVVWLGSVQWGCGGVEARRSRRSSGPPGSGNQLVWAAARMRSQPTLGRVCSPAESGR